MLHGRDRRVTQQQILRNTTNSTMEHCRHGGGSRDRSGQRLRTQPHVLRNTAVLRGGAVDVVVEGASLDGLILPRGTV